jgi:hypothetical protein
MITLDPGLIEVLPELKKGCPEFRCFRSKSGSGLSDQVSMYNIEKYYYHFQPLDLAQFILNKSGCDF